MKHGGSWSVMFNTLGSVYNYGEKGYRQQIPLAVEHCKRKREREKRERGRINAGQTKERKERGGRNRLEGKVAVVESIAHLVGVIARRGGFVTREHYRPCAESASVTISWNAGSSKTIGKNISICLDGRGKSEDGASTKVDNQLRTQLLVRRKIYGRKNICADYCASQEITAIPPKQEICRYFTAGFLVTASLVGVLVGPRLHFTVILGGESEMSG